MPRQLYFQKPIFHKGKNITVRKGTYWLPSKQANILIGQEMVTVNIRPKSLKFKEITDSMLKYEHDPKCRDVEGLYQEMKRMNSGFTRNSTITIIEFKL